MSHQPENFKRNLILNYLIPALGDQISSDTQKVEDIISRCGIKDVVKYQKIESPGPAEEGCLFFSISGMVHSYRYTFTSRQMSGVTIWKRRSLIFIGHSVLDNDPRTDFIQLLEQSEVLYITYPNLLFLMHKYSDIENTIRRVSAEQTAWQFEKIMMGVGVNPVERVRQFRAKYPAFIDCTNQAIQALHVGMSLRSYTNQLKKIRENSSPV